MNTPKIFDLNRYHAAVETALVAAHEKRPIVSDLKSVGDAGETIHQPSIEEMRAREAVGQVWNFESGEWEGEND